MIARLQNWPLQLDRFIEERRAHAFAWGVQDCCQFARRAVEAVTGVDPAASWRLRPYRTAKGATSQLARLGGLEQLPLLAGCMAINPLLATRGDLALAPNDGRPALGVVVGVRVAFAGKQGLEFVSVSTCTHAWRVG